MKFFEGFIKVGEYCSKKYIGITFQHCFRVACYAIANPCIVNEGEKDIVFKLAMCLDLLEDTDATIEEICGVVNMERKIVEDTLTMLTKNKEETYVEYIKRLRNSENKFAYIIKLADMKDHLMQKETLTEKLKEKYWEAMPYLL